ncbi:MULTISPECIES: PspC domain-containing protein [unclassified Ornithinimicrobium]|uniref:PspC domain-containing protein n=1 Tax=unclassified Ornithinimicrobium TaxID=2615080 RepID=UPI003854675C
MNDTQPQTPVPTTPPLSGSSPRPTPQQDVWGVRPAALQDPGTQAGPSSGTGATSSNGGPVPGPSSLDRGFATLRRSPLRRDSENGVLGGVCAGIARQSGLSVAAVRLFAVVLALFFGTGIAAYLVAWAALPDQGGRTHAEGALREGRGRSLVVLGLGALAAFGIVASILGETVRFLPLLLAVAVVGYVVSKRKGRSTTSHLHD